MKLLYGTTNKAKSQAMKAALVSFDIELIGLGDIDRELPYINENGRTPLENAEHHYSSMDMSIATEPFLLGTVPHAKRVEGFPLDSLSIDIATGKYYYDLEVKDVSTSVDDGVRAFFNTVFQ